MRRAPAYTARGAAVSCVLATLLAACGSGGSSAEPVPPTAYVRSVCQAMVRWNSDVAAAFRATDARPDSDSSASIRRDMLAFLDAIQDATDAAGRRVGEAGVPELPDGDRVAGELRDALTTAAAALTENRASFAAIPATDVQPAASIEGTMTTVAEQFDAVRASVQRLDDRSPALRDARRDDPSCKEFDSNAP